jgi:hypothetical protein
MEQRAHAHILYAIERGIQELLADLDAAHATTAAAKQEEKNATMYYAEEVDRVCQMRARLEKCAFIVREYSSRAAIDADTRNIFSTVVEIIEGVIKL